MIILKKRKKDYLLYGDGAIIIIGGKMFLSLHLVPDLHEIQTS